MELRGHVLCDVCQHKVFSDPFRAIRDYWDKTEQWPKILCCRCSKTHVIQPIASAPSKSDVGEYASKLLRKAERARPRSVAGQANYIASKIVQDSQLGPDASVFFDRLQMVLFELMANK